MAKTHYFYVLKCADNTYYAGYTTDIALRLFEHNTSEKGAKYTKVRRPVKLMYAQEYDTRSLATKAEARFKKLTRIQKEAFLYDTTAKEF